MREHLVGWISVNLNEILIEPSLKETSCKILLLWNFQWSYNMYTEIERIKYFCCGSGNILFLSITVKDSFWNCIPVYVLSRVIHSIQSKQFIWKPGLVYRMVGYGWPSVFGLVSEIWELNYKIWNLQLKCFHEIDICTVSEHA